MFSHKLSTTGCIRVLYLPVLLTLAGLATLNYGVNSSDESSYSFCRVTEEHNQQYRTVVRGWGKSFPILIDLSIKSGQENVLVAFSSKLREDLADEIYKFLARLQSFHRLNNILRIKFLLSNFVSNFFTKFFNYGHVNYPFGRIL